MYKDTFPKEETDEAKAMTLPRLRSLRRLSGKSQALVAAELGVAKGTYSAWERGTNEIRGQFIVPLCKSIGCTPNELFGYPEDGDSTSGKVFHILDNDFQFFDLYLRVPEEIRRGLKIIMEGTASSRKVRVRRKS